MLGSAMPKPQTLPESEVAALAIYVKDCDATLWRGAQTSGARFTAGTHDQFFGQIRNARSEGTRSATSGQS
jgi:hypothetical protein